MADPRLIDLPLEGGGEPDAGFYLDPAEPECWLAAERAIRTLGAPAPWIPVALPEGDEFDDHSDQDVSGATSLDSRRGRQEQLARLCSERDLLDFRPPQAWLEGKSLHGDEALLACTYAKQVGKAVAFTLALMRQTWCAARDPRDVTTILLAGAAAEIHPNAIEKALTLKALREELDRASAHAIASGVTATPAVRVGDAIFVGDRGLDEAAAKIRG